MSIQLWNHQTEDWSTKVTVWDNGQVNTNANWNSQTYDESDGNASSFSDTYYSGDPNSIGNCMGLAPCPYPLYENTSGNNVINRNGLILSTRIDNYKSYNAAHNGGCFYNTLFEHGRGLIVRPVNQLSSSSNLKGKLDKWSHHSFGSGITSWYMQPALTMASSATLSLIHI